MNLETATRIRDLLAEVKQLGLEFIPPTHFNGVNQSHHWAVRQVEIATAEMPVLEKIKKDLKDRKAAK